MQLNEFQTPKLYVDLDGVMSDLVAKWAELTGYSRDDIEHGYWTNREMKKKIWKTTNRALKQGVEIWYDLDLMPGAMTLWQFLVRNAGTVGYEIEILTATGRMRQEEVADMKHRWVAKHLSSTVGVITVQDGVDKARYAEEDAILIDDQQKNIDAWERAGGVGILHTDAESTINQLRKKLHGTI